MLSTRSSRLLVLLCMALLAGCASSGKKGPMTEKDYYEAAQRSLRAGNFQTASEHLEALESHYPVGQYTEQAQLDLIYARFRHLDHAGASAAADRFLRLHPGHPQSDYAQYMKGLAAYEADRDVFTRYLPVNPAHRDLSAGREAFREFALLLERYPQSSYAQDARARMRYLRNQMAESELHVARYYAKRRAWVSSLNRSRWVLENYPGAPSVPDALALQVYAYDQLGMTDLAAQQLALLRQNYPQHPGIDALAQELGAQNENRSWLNIFSFGLLGGFTLDD